MDLFSAIIFWPTRSNKNDLNPIKPFLTPIELWQPWRQKSTYDLLRMDIGPSFFDHLYYNKPFPQQGHIQGIIESKQFQLATLICVKILENLKLAKVKYCLTSYRSVSIVCLRMGTYLKNLDGRTDALCSRNFQNVQLRLDFVLINLPPL